VPWGIAEKTSAVNIFALPFNEFVFVVMPERLTHGCWVDGTGGFL
jgi:hypothetical protein